MIPKPHAVVKTSGCNASPIFFDFQPTQSSKPETVSETVYPVLSSLAPVISVGYGANPVQIRPFTPSTGVQIPLGTPMKIKHLHENVSAFFVVGQIGSTPKTETSSFSGPLCPLLLGSPSSSLQLPLVVFVFTS